MENCKTLNEIHNETGITRRAIQGYERAGLVLASDRNKYGHLLYDEDAQKRIVRIKFYQELGFTIKEIKGVIDAPASEVKASLEMRIACLKEERRNMDSLIEKAYELIETL